jgi:hypothetical protein
VSATIGSTTIGSRGRAFADTVKTRSMNFEVGAVIRVRPQNLDIRVNTPSGSFNRFPDFHESIGSTNQEISPEM